MNQSEGLKKEKFYRLTPIKKKSDGRGYLIEFLKNTELKETSTNFGQIYIAIILPKEIRGNHYHTKKTEWFVVLGGKIRIVLKDLKTREEETLILDSNLGDSLTRIEIKPFIVHAFQNLSEEPQVIIAHSNQLYHHNDPDTIKHEIIR